MKIYSEITKELYDSVEECKKAEKAVEDKHALEVKEKEEKLANESKRKKELSKAIEQAEEKVKIANNLYETAKTKAAKILEDSNKQVKDILEKAEKDVKEAEEAKFEAIMNFNKEFGKYTVTLTGEKAIEELNKSLKRFDSIARNFLNTFWF